MTQFQPEEKIKLKRQKLDQAIQLAMHSRWDEAIEVNKSLIALFPGDAETYNRLGKAYSELHRFEEAIGAYQEAVKLDGTNVIARKNLQRLQLAFNEKSKSKTPAAAPRVNNGEPARKRGSLDPQLFIEETGKTAVTILTKVAPLEMLAMVNAGDKVVLVAEGLNLVVRTEDGEYLGTIEPKLAHRVVEFMKAGNRYSAAITNMDNHQVRMILRETYQSPKMAGRVSFPARSVPGGYRPYTKDTMLRFGDLEADEEFDFDNDDGDDDGEESEEVESEYEEEESEPED